MRADIYYLGEVFRRKRLCIFIEVSVVRTSVTAASMLDMDSRDCICIILGAV